MNRKLLSLFLVAIFALLAIPAAAQDATIRVWITGSDDDAAVLQEVVGAWEASTGNTVQVEAVGWGDAYARALAAVTSGEGADILMGGMSWGISLGALDGMVDLGATFPDDVAAIGAAANPGFFNAIVNPEGTIYGLPYNLDTYLFYYRPAAFEAAGVAVPTTWEELETALQAGIKGGIGWGNASWLSFQNFLYQAGGMWYTADCSAPAIDSAEGLAALEFYTKLYEEYGFPAEEVGTAAAFSTGERDFVIDGEWTAGGINLSYPELEGTWSVSAQPAGPAGFTAFIGGKAMSLFSFSPNQDAAFDLMKFLSSDEAAQGLTSGYIARSQIYVPTSPEFAQYIQGGDDLNAALSSQLSDAAGPPNCPGWEETNADVNLVLQSVLFEGANFEDALAEMNDIMTEGLEEYGS